MRNLLLATTLAAFTGAAFAGGNDLAADYLNGNDYSAKLYYRLDFGGGAPHAQTLGLRFDHRYTAALGTPDVLQARFTGVGAPVVKLQGLELRGPNLVAGQQEGTWSWFWSLLTPGEWIAMGVGVVAVAAVAGSVSGGSNPQGSGSGGG